MEREGTAGSNGARLGMDPPPGSNHAAENRSSKALVTPAS
jgi:hypothetical protein